MNKATICIGSNAPDACKKVSDALEWVKAELQGSISHGPYPTEPFGHGASDAPYCNAVVTGTTCLTIESLTRLFKDYEAANGRKHGSSFPDRIAIDIDLVVWNGTVMRPADYNAPYFTEGARHRPDL